MGKKNTLNSATTMKDVAKLAGLSEMTVSRVMTGKGYVSSSSEKKVIAAAEELGYVHNKVAGALASSYSNLVGVVIPTISNVVFTEVMSGIYAGLEGTGLQPVFGMSEYSQTKEEKLIQDMLAWRPQGLIVTGLEHTSYTRSILKKAQQKIVEINDVDGSPVSTCIGLSHKNAGKVMAEYLLSKGYRKFGYIGTNLELDLRAKKRRAAFIEEVEAAGAKIVKELTPSLFSSMALGKELTGELLTSNKKIDVIYYSNDDLAAGGLMHCLMNGIKPPTDIALASFNGLSFIDSLPLKITTIRSPRFTIGQLAGEFISSNNLNTRFKKVNKLDFTLDIGDTT